MHNEKKYAVKESSISKLIASELADKTAYEVLQFFGGYGYMEEYKIARAFRDSRIGTIGGGTSEIMREIIAKMIIDDTNYDRATSNSSKSTVSSPATVEDIFATLPNRFKKEKAKDISLNVLFEFENDLNYSVLINNGNLSVQKEKVLDTYDLILTTDKATYIAVETGKINPQEAFMTGKIKVSELMKMMEFGGLIKRL
jgi:hypothetical protein